MKYKLQISEQIGAVNMKAKNKLYYIILVLLIILVLMIVFGFSKLQYIFGKNYSEYEDFLNKLPFFGNKEVDLSGNHDYEKIDEFKNQYPDIDVSYTVSLPQMGEVEDTAESLKFDSLTKAEFSELFSALEYLPNVRTISFGNFGGENSFKSQDLLSLKNAYPETDISGNYEFYDKTVCLSDSLVDINHIRLDDNGDEILALAKCMPNLEFLDMDSCGVPNERMAEIRDALPNVKVVWRVWFGRNYTARTDVERILASKPPEGGLLRNNNVQTLKYCTDVKYLDLGHNGITDISFVSEMKDLEVCIIGLNSWSDISPLSNCIKIEYLEIMDVRLDNLEPLRNMKGLKHLNAANNLFLRDISPLFDLNLERLWLGCMHNIPTEQIREFKKQFPDCRINTTVVDSMSQGWRLHERYKELKETFGYFHSIIPYNFYWLDPLVQPQDMDDRVAFVYEMRALGE